MGIATVVDGASVIRYRTGKRGKLPLAPMQCKLINTDHESTLKLDGNSRGLQSLTACGALRMGQFNLAAVLMVIEHQYALAGVSYNPPMLAVCGSLQIETSIQPERKPMVYVHCGQTVHAPMRRIDNSIDTVRYEEESWRKSRQPERNKPIRNRYK